MASITIRSLSPESRARLRRRAEERGCSLEALARSILDQAAEEAPPATRFPHDLIALVEPGEDIEPFIRGHRQPRAPVDLRDQYSAAGGGLVAAATRRTARIGVPAARRPDVPLTLPRRTCRVPG